MKKSRGKNSQFFTWQIPKFPLSVLVFYLIIFVLWNLQIIPAPNEIFVFLERLFEDYGQLGLFGATFLEGIAYLGLYFPGSFIVGIAVILSDGSFGALFLISVLVAAALTIDSAINYFLGKYFSSEEERPQADQAHEKLASKGLFFSMVHPNSLALYFFKMGLDRRSPWKIVFVPLVIVPYGFVLANLLYPFKIALRRTLESPFLMISIISIWFALVVLYENLIKKKEVSS